MEYFIGGIVHRKPVRSTSRNIISVINYQNQIIPHIFIACDYPVIKFLQKGVILQSAAPKAQKKFLGSPFFLAGKGKFQIQKIFPDCAGEGLAQQFKIFKDFLLGKGEKGFFEFCFFIFSKKLVISISKVNQSLAISPTTWNGRDRKLATNYLSEAGREGTSII